jgi:hypothetical protein
VALGWGGVGNGGPIGLASARVILTSLARPLLFGRTISGRSRLVVCFLLGSAYLRAVKGMHSAEKRAFARSSTNDAFIFHYDDLKPFGPVIAVRTSQVP